VRKRKKLTLMPVIALAALSLLVALPTLSGTRLYAASASHYATVTVRAGDTLWTIAAAHTGPDGDVQETIDQITQASHLRSVTLQAGQQLRVPTP